MSTGYLPGPYHPQTGALCTPPSPCSITDGAQLYYPSFDDTFTHHISEMITEAINQCQVVVKQGFDALGARLDSMQRDIQEVRGELIATKLELGNTKKELNVVGRGLNVIGLMLKPPSSTEGVPSSVENVQTKLNLLNHQLAELTEGIKNSIVPKVMLEVGIETESVPTDQTQPAIEPLSLNVDTSPEADAQVPHASLMHSGSLSESSTLHDSHHDVTPQKPPPKIKKKKQLTEELIADALEVDLLTSSATRVNASLSRASSQGAEPEMPPNQEGPPPISSTDSQAAIQEELLAPFETPSRRSSRTPTPVPHSQPLFLPEEEEPATPSQAGAIDLATPPSALADAPPIDILPIPEPQPSVESEKTRGSERLRSQSIVMIKRLEDEELEPLTEISSSMESEEEDQLKDDPSISPPRLTIHINKGKLLSASSATAGKKRKQSTAPSGSTPQKKARVARRSTGRRRSRKPKILVSWPECDPANVIEEPEKLVSCDGCSRTYHHLCVGLVEGDVRLKEDEIFICPLCVCGQAGEGFGKGHEIPHPQCSRPECPIEIYYVEKLVGRRPQEDGFMYLVKWINYDICDCTWEPPANFEPERLDAFAELAAKEGVDLDTTENEIVLLEGAKDGTGTWKDW